VRASLKTLLAYRSETLTKSRVNRKKVYNKRKYGGLQIVRASLKLYWHTEVKPSPKAE